MRRGPFLHWLLTMATLGLYGYGWIFLMVRDVSRLNPEAKIDLRKHVKWFSAVFGLLLFAGITMQFLGVETELGRQWIDTVGVGLSLVALGLTIYVVWLVVFIAKALGNIDSTGKPATGIVILLSLLWMTSLPYLQGRLNRKLEAPARAPS